MNDPSTPTARRGFHPVIAGVLAMIGFGTAGAQDTNPTDARPQAIAGAQAHAQIVTCEGVLGNSGEQGKCLVKFGANPAKGMGVAYDRFGSLWDRGGAGVLNRYAPDGRMLEQHRIPRESDDQDKLTIVGDLVVMQVKGKLYTLDVSAPPDAEPKPLGIDSQCMSFGSSDGCVASYNKGKILLVNVKTGQAKDAPGAWEIDPNSRMSCLELTPDGKVVSQIQAGRLRLYVNGKEVPGGLTEKPSVSRLQFLDGSWFGHAWHGTIKRFDAALQPAPGTVLGGASGWVIGHLDENAELFNGCGMAKLGEGLYAVSGQTGVVHLLRWQADKQKMEIIRRIGAVWCTGLGLDREGAVWAGMGTWQWTDAPDAPLQSGISGQSGMGQAVMTESDTMVQPASRWGKSVLITGRLNTEPRFEDLRGLTLVKNPVGAAAYAHQGKGVLLVIDKGGKAQALYVGQDGAYHGDGPAVALRPAATVKEWTSLGMKGPDTLLAAGDGAVIELARDRGDWKETRRWNSWRIGSADDRFGGRISVCGDSSRLWVSDSLRHRVLCFDMAGGALLGQFGRTDKPATDLTGLGEPGVIAARSGRAVVFDSGNQRLVKLKIGP